MIASKMGLTIQFISSTGSGFVLCCFMQPPDRVMTCLYNQNGNLYRGVLDCLYKIIAVEGVLAVCKGFFPM